MSTVTISPDGRYIAAGTFDGNVYVFLTSDKDDVWYHSDALDGKITDISGLIQVSDIIAHSSINEGLPNAILEGMKCKKEKGKK